jgi:hypothetical protein
MADFMDVLIFQNVEEIEMCNTEYLSMAPWFFSICVLMIMILMYVYYI